MRTKLWPLMAGVFLLQASTPSWAEDYTPVSCPAAKPYAGPALHAPLDLTAFHTDGELSAGLPPATSARLDAAFAKARIATKAHAMTAAVGLPGQGLWASQSGDQMPLFFWASIGKQATALVILQLAEEGRLDLEDPISKWVSNVPNGDAITIRNLLEHTGGLFSASEDAQVHRGNRPLSLTEELAVLNRHGALACPGERWKYSNSGYNLLGAVVEKLDGGSLAQSIQVRIAKRLGLADFHAVTPDLKQRVNLPVSDTADAALDISVPGAAGPVVASASDMIRFQQALLDGRLLRPATLTGMLQRPLPMFQPGMFYGLGIMLYDVPDKTSPLRWIGHSGGASGVQAVSVYDPGANAFVAVALTGGGSAEASANLLLKALAGG